MTALALLVVVAATVSTLRALWLAMDHLAVEAAEGREHYRLICTSCGVRDGSIIHAILIAAALWLAAIGLLLI